jgi:glycosyltransferase involved in cell wall biosynthesis
LQRHPVLQNLDSLPLEVYDAFMFTSRFEGMPNVALEMAARGIPCISSDVGGLREVFDDACVDFVSAQLPLGMTVRGFSDGIDAILRRSNEALVTRVRKARAAVESRHSSAAFAQRLRGVLNQRANAK